MCWNLFRKKEKKGWWTCCDSLAPHAHWLLRLAVASAFLYHGVMKFSDMEMWNGFSAFLGIPEPLAFLVPLAEAGGAILILIGGLGWDWATRLGGLAHALVMAGAIALVHWGQWGNAATENYPAGGMEFPVTLLAISLYFLVVGNGVMCPGGACTTKK